MPHKARIDAPKALHHIIIRGIERSAVFKDSSDQNNFVKRLGRIIKETDIEYILKLFGKSITQARRDYESFVAKGVAQGRRLDLVGGGLLRAVGGWAELKELRDIGVRI